MDGHLEVRTATPEMFGDIRGVLSEFGPGFGDDEWRRIFDYDFDRDRRDRGWVLLDGEHVVGFLGAIFSLRRGERFCNVTSWVVKKSHRSRAGLRLLLPLLAMKDHTILNLSPTPFTLSVFRRMGFCELDDRLVIIPPFYPQATPRGYRRITDPEVMDGILQGEDRQVFRDHRRYPCAHVLFAGPRDYSYVVAGKTRLRHLPASFIYYRSSPTTFRKLLGATARALATSQRTLISIIDGRLCADAPLRGCPTYKLHQPRLYRPAARSTHRREDIDTLYSEFVLLDPRLWVFNY